MSEPGEHPVSFVAFCEEAAKKSATLHVTPRLLQNSALIAIDVAMAEVMPLSGSIVRRKFASFIVNGIVVTGATKGFQS